jgi:hypothetical protein
MSYEDILFFNSLTKENVIFSKNRVEINARESGKLDVVCDNDNIKTKVPKFLRILGKKYTDPEIFSTGSFGIIIKYTNKKSNSAICVKTEKKNKSIKCDIKMAKDLAIPKNTMIPSIVRSNRIIMPILFSDLEKFIHKLKDKLLVTSDTVNDIRINILHSISKNLAVLIDSGYYYTDLKIDNIVYYVKNNTIIPLLCDYDGLSRETDNGTYTYFSPERAKAETKKYDLPCELDVVWGIGCIMCEMWNLSPIFEQDNWDESCQKKLEYTLNNLIECYPQGEKIFKRIFTKSDDRITMKQLLRELELLDKIKISGLPININDVIGDNTSDIDININTDFMTEPKSGYNPESDNDNDTDTDIDDL